MLLKIVHFIYGSPYNIYHPIRNFEAIKVDREKEDLFYIIFILNSFIGHLVQQKNINS